MEERNYWLGFSMAPGIGPKSLDLLARNFESLKKAWSASESELLPILKPVLTSKFLKFRDDFDLERYKKQLEKQKISFITLLDKEYPSLLKSITNPPSVLYAKGDITLLNSPSIAIVGTRRITNYGREITELFAKELASSGLTIVSGMAFGVDGAAHKGAIDAGGKTIAVLGNGVDVPYPKENEKLYEEILDSDGLIISEYPPGTPPGIGTFPARNRIIAGISEGVLVTEGAEDSGSLITANFGLEFERRVFAIPGPITSSLSKAPLELIEKGARLVTSAESILKELKFEIQNTKSETNSKSKNTKFKTENKIERKILEVLENEGLYFDEIVKKTGISSQILGSTLSMMEVKGIIKNSGSLYSVNN
ncbi:MAG: DNA-processing protein DprA [Patescibacteria group bacterium]